MSETNEQVQKLVEAHYFDALQIAQSYKTAYVTDDERETIAVDALYRAAETFKEDNKSKTGQTSSFTTWLYRLIFQRVQDAARKKERALGHIPIQSMSESPTETWDIADYFFDTDADYISMAGSKNYLSNMTERRQTRRFNYLELMAMLQPRLSRRQWLIVNYMFYPERLQQKYRKYKFASPPSRITPTIIANALRVSRQLVHVEMKTIRHITEVVLKQIDFGHPNTRGLAYE